MVVNGLMIFFRVVMLCGLVGGYICYGGMYLVSRQSPSEVRGNTFFQNIGNHL
jgi:hypothetical protein